MKNILFKFVILFTIVALTSCYYDHPPEASPIECDEVSYSTHIVPILDKYCSTPGCHDGSIEPDLSASISWNSLVNDGYVNLAAPEASVFYEVVEFIGTPMPIGVQLSEQNRALILCWITEGAKNN